MRALLAVLLVAACNDCPAPLDECLEQDGAITQGIYGRVLVGQDVRTNECPTVPAPSSTRTISVREMDSVVVEVDTDADGIYVADVPPGIYVVCAGELPSSRGVCSEPVELTSRLRIDFSSSVFTAAPLVVSSARCR